jgi:hypothetical protein
MRRLLAAFGLLLMPASSGSTQPADCAPRTPGGRMLPLALDFAGRPGTSSRTTGTGTGTAYVEVPLAPPGNACARSSMAPSVAPPSDVLHGQPGDVLTGPASPDLLRGPGEPRVRMAPP